MCRQTGRGICLLAVNTASQSSSTRMMACNLSIWLCWAPLLTSCCCGLCVVRREGKFHVLQEEPEVTAADAIDSAMSFMGMQPSMNMGSMNLASMSGYSLSRDSPFNAQPAEFSASELDTLKAQLEALLPAASSDDEGDNDVASS